LSALSEKSYRERFQFRAGWVRLGFLLIIVVILARALYLQVYEREKLEAMAERQHNQTLSVQLQRGPILDSNGKILTVSLPMDSAFVIPTEVEQPRVAARQLAAILETSEERVLSRLTAKSSFVWLQRNLKPVDAERIKALKLSGVYHLTEYQRFYPLENHAAQLIGFSGIDSQGLEGLEFQYDAHLMAGTSRHSAIKTLYWLPEQNHLHGGSLKLTINSKLQYIAEEELRRAVHEMSAKHGVAIIMASQTGHILAMANIPDFDPNVFERYPRSTYFNHAVSASYEPGSTFKIITIAAALENNVIEKDQYYYCEEGRYQIQDRLIHDVARYGWLSIEQIVQKSSNICAAKIGQMIPKPLFYRTILEFGFGSRTGIGLPGESPGKVFNYENWSATDVATMSFGHSIAATPIQILTAINAIATGGILIQPTVIAEVRKANGQLLERDRPQQKRVVKPEVAKAIKSFMVAATQPEGTGFPARLDGVTVAGKTGTSRKFDLAKQEYSTENHIVSFVGFFPAENPRFTILVMIDEPQKSYLGSRGTTPIFRRIAQQTQFLFPDHPSPETLPSHPPTDVVLFRSANETTSTPNGTPGGSLEEELQHKSLREALLVAGHHQVTLDIKGSGIVRRIAKDQQQSGRYYIELR
jgi:cell division protein FtsI (penicillin-binding protein 3)